MNVELINCRDEEFAQVKEIRYNVFTLEQGIAVSDDLDELDKSPDTVYALVFNGEKAVSTGRLIQQPSGYKIGRIATLKSSRGKGCGALLVNALCDKAFELGADKIHLEAQCHAIPFYERLGFRVVSDEVIIDRGIEHRKMIKEKSYE